MLQSQTCPNTLPSGGSSQPNSSKPKPEIIVNITGIINSGFTSSATGVTKWYRAMTSGRTKSQIVSPSSATVRSLCSSRCNMRVGHGRVSAISRWSGSSDRRRFQNCSKAMIPATAKRLC